MAKVEVKVDTARYLELVQKSGLVEPKVYRGVVASLKDALTGKMPEDPLVASNAFIKTKQLTQWQSENLLRGKHKGFTLGRYLLLGHLGTGGMSSVYLAQHTLMKRKVAIKVLPPSKVSNTSYLARFRREAEAIAQLDHPNIVRAYDIDHEGNTHYFVMEFVDGKDFLVLVRENGPFGYRQAADYIAQAAEGLQHAHDAGLIHRDIKPANCLVDQTDTVKVLDLGLALFTEEEGPSLTLANDENVLGTADYLAPEQALDSHGVDSRADIYGLGCTLYFLLTGHPPFPKGTISERLIKHQREEPKPISDDRSDVPEGLAAICRDMMSKSRRKRIQTCREVAGRLRAWLEKGSKKPSTATDSAQFGSFSSGGTRPKPTQKKPATSQANPQKTKRKSYARKT